MMRPLSADSIRDRGENASHKVRIYGCNLNLLAIVD